MVVADTPDAKEERIKALEVRIQAVEDDYITWWGLPTDKDSRLSFVRDTLQQAELHIEPMDLVALDDYSSDMASALATVNGNLPALEKFHSSVKGLVAQLVTLRGYSGFPYKDIVEGDERVAGHWESYRLAERLSATITHQLKNIDSRNFRIGQEIKAGTWTNNPRLKEKPKAVTPEPAGTHTDYP